MSSGHFFTVLLLFALLVTKLPTGLAEEPNANVSLPIALLSSYTSSVTLKHSVQYLVDPESTLTIDDIQTSKPTCFVCRFLVQHGNAEPFANPPAKTF